WQHADPRECLLLPRHRGAARAVEEDPRTGVEARHVHPRRRVLAHRVHPLRPAPRPQHRRPPRMRRDPMPTPIRRIVIIAVLGLAMLTGAAWAIFGLTSTDDEEDSPGTAVMPSGGGETEPSDDGGPSDGAPASPSDDPGQIEFTGDFTDPEQVALAFATTYPGHVEDISDPTFYASLDGLDASLAREITSPRRSEERRVGNGLRSRGPRHQTKETPPSPP